MSGEKTLRLDGWHQTRVVPERLMDAAITAGLDRRYGAYQAALEHLDYLDRNNSASVNSGKKPDCVTDGLYDKARAENRLY